jgi:hypothetical protein
MPNPQRLEFITRHFNDLQTIRLAPLPMAMLLAPVAHRVPHVGRGVAWGALLAFLLGVGGFYWWTTIAIRRRYGSVKVSRGEGRQQRPLVIRAIQLIVLAGLLWFGFFARAYFWDLYIPSTIFIGMLTTVLDSTNTTSRRFAWAIGLAVLFSAGPLLVGIDGGAAIFSLAGGVWLSLSIFDFLLLRRTFAEISDNPPTAATEGVVRYG